MGLRVLALVLLLGCFACADDGSETTRLVLVSDTDMPELDQVRFAVRAPSQRVQEATAPVGRGAPAWLVMEREAGSLGPYDITVTGLSLGVPTVERVARVSFVRGRTLTVLLHLVEACRSAMPLACTAEQVCSHTGCRSTEVVEDELDAFTGIPPRLPGGPVGHDGGTERDAGRSRDDAGPMAHDAGMDADAGSCRPDAVCLGDELARCEGGSVVGEACEQPGFCKRAVCSEQAAGCVTQSANEGEPCGTGLTCVDGVCRGQSCTGNNCAPRCNTDVAQCELDCTGATRCLPACPQGQQCDVRCSADSNCLPSCQGNCTVDCGTATACRVSCSGAEATCDVRCSGANCNRIECTAGARCVMHCGGAASCRFRTCEGDTQVTCPDGSVVCNRACP